MKEGRVMFVDDEPQVLESLKDLLWQHRKVWDFAWASSGENALQQLQTEPADVVVTDLRMPVMDGATLLQKVKAQHPGTVRIVLSGHGEAADMSRAAQVAQQMLSKPCDAGHLTSTLQRVLDLRRVLTQPSLRTLIGEVESLPPAPRVYLELTQALSNPEVKNAHLASIVETDPALSVKVLQLVNSAFFGLPQRMSSITNAVLYLGVETLRGLALASDVFAPQKTSWPRQMVDDLQERSLLAARVARQLVGSGPAADQAFTAGIVHDIGQLLLAVASPKAMEQVDAELLAGLARRHQLEERALGITHAEVGAYLLGTWGLPLDVVEAVAHHHRPQSVRTGDRRVIAAVHAASGWVNALLDKKAIQLADVDLTFVGSAGLKPTPTLIKIASDTVAKFLEKKEST